MTKLRYTIVLVLLGFGIGTIVKLTAQAAVPAVPQGRTSNVTGPLEIGRTGPERLTIRLNLQDGVHMTLEAKDFTISGGSTDLTVKSTNVTSVVRSDQWAGVVTRK